MDSLPGFKTLPFKWVCPIKRNTNNVFEKYKVQIIVNDYAKEVGFDFDKTFTSII